MHRGHQSLPSNSSQRKERYLLGKKVVKWSQRVLSGDPQSLIALNMDTNRQQRGCHACQDDSLRLTHASVFCPADGRWAAICPSAVQSSHEPLSSWFMDTPGVWAAGKTKGFVCPPLPP